LPIPDGEIKEIAAITLSQNRTHQGYLRDSLDSVHEIATVSMNRPDEAINLVIFNAE
jgi:hypothetical protein